ncbi:hypothetical protein [Paracoccus cavernae]|uniref:hypothetical protein n=1 Tax=Paracoccus cavernae TaxID=1571207 RepID=UPI003635572F
MSFGDLAAGSYDVEVGAGGAGLAATGTGNPGSASRLMLGVSHWLFRPVADRVAATVTAEMVETAGVLGRMATRASAAWATPVIGAATLCRAEMRALGP